MLDDGSTDETPQYAKTISDRRVQYVRLEKVGLVGALNTGLKLAKSELIARMDADDIAISTRLARQHEMFRMDSQLIVGSTGYERIDEHGDLHCSQQTIPMPTTHAAITFFALFAAPFLHPGSMFRREHAEREPRPISLDAVSWLGIRVRWRAIRLHECVLPDVE